MTRRRERQLIQAAIDGDRSAAEGLIRAHQASLYAYMLRMSGRPEMAEDIVQDAFVRALTNLQRFDFRFRFSTWLFTIAKRLYVNACQKHRPAYDSDIVNGREGVWRSPDAPAICEEVSDNARSALDEALASLGAEQREILILFHQLDWSIAQISEHLDMPEGTIKSHLHRGRRKMRRYIEEHASQLAMVEEVWK